MLKIRNAQGKMGVLIDGGWTEINETKGTRQGILSNEQKNARAAKKKRHEQNKIARANENKNRFISKKGK
jgi:hypothetical protein